MAVEHFTTPCTFHVTTQLKSMFESAAAARGITLSEFLRRAAVEGTVNALSVAPPGRPAKEPEQVA
jgi:hypothetical protein